MNAHTKRLGGRMMVGVLIGVLPAIGLAFVVSLSAGSVAASVRCQGRYRDFALPVYDRLVTVNARQHLTCSQASRVGNAVATVYERGLPVADYPPLPRGVPDGQSHPFSVRTRYGVFTCVMTARGSDFVAARCRSGVRFVRFFSGNHWFLHGH
jgi:hypothetical protein